MKPKMHSIETKPSAKGGFNRVLSIVIFVLLAVGVVLNSNLIT